MTLDVLYLAHNRREFTQFTFEKLLANTDWSLVRQLVVYDDGSEDGTLPYLTTAIRNAPVAHRLERRRLNSPVAIMNDYVAATDSDWFAKIDNDIAVPPNWLNEMVGVLERNPTVEVLGMEAGRMGYPGADGAPWDGVYGFEPGSHIGGVGLVKTSVIGTRRMIANGRYGWTEFQTEFKPVRGWIIPDLAVCSLDQLPFEPWQSLALRYAAAGWSRLWPPYFERWMHYYWEWFAPWQGG